MRGRKAPGPEFAQGLQGSPASKLRLEVILKTIAGELSIEQASKELGITPQRLHSLRQEALQAAVHRLEPRPLGRPRRRPAPAAALEAEVARLQQEVEAARLHTEIALVLPGRRQPKKGNSRT